MTGVDSIDETILLTDELTRLLKLGQFEFEWIEVFDEKDFNNTIDVQIITNERNIVKTWQPSDDKLQFESRAMPNAETKHDILSSISKLFDSLGLASFLIHWLSRP